MITHLSVAISSAEHRSVAPVMRAASRYQTLARAVAAGYIKP